MLQKNCSPNNVCMTKAKFRDFAWRLSSSWLHSKQLHASDRKFRYLMWDASPQFAREYEMIRVVSLPENDGSDLCYRYLEMRTLCLNDAGELESDRLEEGCTIGRRHPIHGQNFSNPRASCSFCSFAITERHHTDTQTACNHACISLGSFHARSIGHLLPANHKCNCRLGVEHMLFRVPHVCRQRMVLEVQCLKTR